MKKKNINNRELGFQIPQDFFKNFEDEMMTQLSIDQKLGDETGFQVPEGYFENLEEQLLPVADHKKTVNLSQQSNSVTRYLYPVMAVAAILAIVITLNTGNGIGISESIDIASVETSELEEYLVNEEFLYDDDSVEILFEDSNILDGVNFSDGLDTDDLYDYLENEIELNEIIIE